jgi:hypothetical protein
MLRGIRGIPGGKSFDPGAPKVTGEFCSPGVVAVVAPQNPLPLRAMTCGLKEALSLISTVPDISPAPFGEKVTLMVQLALGATALPQVEVAPNSPVVLMELMERLALPWLVNLTICGGLVLPCFWFMKLSSEPARTSRCRY